MDSDAVSPKKDLQNDLLADLQGAVNARPLPAEAPLPEPGQSGELRPPTPSVDVRFTPLRWGRPRIVSVPDGLGVGVRIGPLRISVAISS